MAELFPSADKQKDVLTYSDKFRPPSWPSGSCTGYT